MTTTFVSHPNAGGLVKISGRISNYKCTRARASFVFTQSDQTKMGVIAVAAGLAGLSGQAILTAANASSVEEEADYIEFDLDDQRIKGWVWRSPFGEGDHVLVAAEHRGSQLEAYGITRPRDKVVALYPHCSRGARSHLINASKWWIASAAAFTLICIIGAFTTTKGYSVEQLWQDVLVLGAVALAFFALMTYSLARKWLPFVRLAEKVFTALGLPDPSNVDLVKSSKKSRTPQDPPEFGTFYFRY